jgi:hypothetical protein
MHVLPTKGALCTVYANWYSEFGIAIRYSWTVRGLNLSRRRDFLHPSRPASRPTQPAVQSEAGLFPVGKATGVWR